MTMTQMKPFRLLIAQDLMTRDLLLIPKEASLKHAAHMLAQSQVSGAPVVDEAGCCIGVLSTTDFMRWVEDEKRRPAHSSQESCSSEWEMMNAETLPADEVGTFMTGDPITVPPETRIAELARMMLDAHIHRIIVVDDQRRPVGVVTSTDLLAAVARSVHSF